MSKRRKNVRISWLKISSILLIFVAIFSLLGTLGLTSLGRALFSLFSLKMGTMAWLIPFLCLVFSFILWPTSSQNNYSRRSRSDAKMIKSAYSTSSVNKRVTNRTTKKAARDLGIEENNAQKQTFPLPATKIVPIRGFDKYFVSMEWSEQADLADTNKMPELGKDFPSYFGEGQPSFFKPSVKITTLKGLKSYLEAVDHEVKKELVDQKTTTLKKPPELQVTIPEKPEHPSYGVSPQEREILLGKHVKSANQAQPINFQIAAKEVSATIEPEAKIPFKENSLEEVLTQDEDLTITNELTIDEVLAIAETSDLPLRFRRSWQLPNFNLLENLPVNTSVYETESSKQLEGVLQDFGISAKVIRVTRGPVITRYELAPAPGVKISRIVNLADDIALGLAARDVRIEAPIPGKSAMGIEVPNKNPRAVPFREVLETPAYAKHASKLKAALGKDIADQPVIADLSKMPHLLVAGATGSGKSVCITTLINSLLFNATPDEVKFLLIDPKMVELNHYNGIPHLLAPVVTDPKKAAAALKWIVKEMETRYELFAAASVRDIERYNKLKITEGVGETASALPWIVVIIDELADLMLVAAGEVEEAICRLAQMARAAGIHLVIATQRPSVDVITGIIKANIPSRISFAVTSSIDSRTILDATGAEKLLGKGDMLYSPQGMNKPQRVQGCLVNDEEVQRVIAHWKAQGRPDYLDPEHLFSETSNNAEETSGPDDSLFINAGQLFISSGIASVSYLQRRLKLGYARAARLMDKLEENGVVGGFEGSKPRQILLSLEEFNERFS
ncbi:MAG: DNA translocase FtsK [Desulfitobacteriaceae bacterium]